MSADTLRTVITGLITLLVLGTAGYGTLTGVDVGFFRELAMLVGGYWFGAGASDAVAKAAAKASNTDRLPSVL